MEFRPVIRLSVGIDPPGDPLGACRERREGALTRVEKMRFLK